ncbi:hypothetical protein M5K25_020670 [Dendrobium thyrsiflorum]|uniref:Autophagy-related protein 13 N-terminal domain-containing protein n=1 Tax=Dendrobium thyrsiflorum TaxID=117978 RepID=A0ABD0UAN1_DENTH
MASSPSKSASEPAVMEKLITDFFDKSVHVILESRSSARNYNAEPFNSSPSSSSSLNIRPKEKRFNLALRDCPATLESFDMWRQSNLEPLVLDIVLDRRKSIRNESCASPGGVFVRNLSSGRDEFGRLNRSETIVERWIVQYESQSISQPGRESSYRGSKKGSRATYHSSEFQIMYKKAYRKIMVLLRSLYVMVRLLPTFKLFRDLTASGQVYPFILSHRISSIAEPFSREEDALMSQHDFGQLDISFGKLSISVAYLKTLEDVSSGPSTPISTEFIMDYVGSPLVDPLKRLLSLPTVGSAPSHASFSRRHSWSNDHEETPFSPTPSPTYSDSQALYHNLNPRLPPRYHLPKNSTTLCSNTRVSFAGNAKNISECWPSPPFSPSSSSPSSPTHLYSAFSHSEGASVSIPLPWQKGSDGGQNQGLSPSPYYKSKRQGRPSQVDTLRTQENTTSALQKFSPENKLQLKIESSRFMEFQTGMVPPKIESTGRELNSLKTPYSPPQISSRSSSRLSFMDEFDDSDFICPFAEDDEVSNSFRVESAISNDCFAENLCPKKPMPIRRSPDAAVGELVWMLRSAPPLRLNNSNPLRSKQVFKDEVSSQKNLQGKIVSTKEDDLNKVDSTLCLDITASDLFKSRTAADAFKELQTYKNIRELILKHGGSGWRDFEYIAKSYSGDPSKVV